MASSAPTSPIIANLLSVARSRNTQIPDLNKNRYHHQNSTTETQKNFTANDNHNNYTASPIHATSSDNSTSSLDSATYTTSEEEDGATLRNSDTEHSNDEGDKSTTNKSKKVDTKNFGSKTASGHSRIFNCKLCERAFTREEHLTRHVQSTHNKLKPFVCGICSRPFSRRDLLLRHAKNLHDGSEKAINRIRRSYKNKRLDEKANSQERGDVQSAGPRLLGGQMRGSTLQGIHGTSGVSVGDETDVSEEEEDVEEGHIYSNGRAISSLVKNNKRHNATPSVTSSDGMGSPIDESPETKRLKMSVNMLVS